jgi:hypothetical protein
MRYVEQELAKRRGKEVDASQKEDKDQVDELYVVPDHLKVCLKPRLTCLLFPLSFVIVFVSDVITLAFVLQVKKRNSEESSTQWTTGIAEVQLPIE